MVTVIEQACLAAYGCEAMALRAVNEAEQSDVLADQMTDIEHACAMTARARVEQVRAVVALLMWGLS